MITRKISYKIAVVLLAMCQLIQVFSTAVYAEDLDDSGNAYETSDAITDAVASEDSFPNDGEVDVSLISSGDVGKVTYYAAIDDDWVEVATGNTVEGKAVLSGKSRYYVTADMLQSVYGAFGFDASNYNGERIFPHTDTYDPNHIWADAAPDGVGGEAKIPVSNREESYLFYVPNNVAGNSAYFTTSVLKSNMSVIKANSFYTITVTDYSGLLDEDKLPFFTSYISSGDSMTFTLPMEDGVRWVFINDTTKQVVEPSAIEETKNADEKVVEEKVTFNNITYPIRAEALSGVVSFEYSATAKNSLIRLGEFGVENQVLQSDATIHGNPSYVNVYNDGEYVVAAPDVDRVMTLGIRGYEKERYFYYYFDGWQIEDTDKVLQSGQILSESEVNDLIKQYGDAAGVITLNAKWNGVSDDENSRVASINFYVNKDCEIMDNMSNGFESQHMNDFTESVYSTKILNVDGVPKTDGGEIQIVAPPTSSDTAYEVDATLRASTDTPLSYGVSVETFPSDETILAKLRAEQDTTSTPISLDGVRIPADELTTDNFQVRWYVLKYERSDGWHIDGVLVAKRGMLTITKTFAGDNEAISDVKSGNYAINITHMDSESNESVSDYTLVLKDSSSNVGEGETGYTRYDSDTDTYTWVLPVAQKRTYTVKESNYLPSDSDKWHSDVRVKLANAASDDSEWKIYDSENGIQVTAKTYASDVPDAAYTGVQIENIYVRAGMLRIHKQDAYSGHGLESVSFVLSRANGKSLTLYKKPGTREYSTDSAASNNGYTEIVPNNVIETDSNGNLYISLDVDSNEDLAGEYYLEEISPEGYTGIPKMLIRVTDKGVIEFVHKAADGGELTNVDGVNTSTLTIKNESEKYESVVVKKTWSESCDTQKPVIIQLYCNGAKMDGYKKQLTSEINWQWIWHDLPLYIDGNLAVYSIKEIAIGNDYMDFTSENPYGEYVVSYSDAQYFHGESEESHDVPVWSDSGSENIFADKLVLNVTNGKSVDFRTITVTKTVTGNMGDTEKSFDFTVLAVKDGKRQGFNINGIDSVDGQVKFSLKHGESVQFRIPAGTTAYITEDTYSGYRTSYKLNSNDFKRGSTASIESISENVEVQFVNNKEAAPNVGISIEPKDNQKYSSVLVVAILLLIGMLVSSAKSMREKS